MTSFLDLPPELRNIIYHLAVDRDGVVEIPSGPFESSQPALSRVHKQIRNEFVPVWRAVTLDAVFMATAEVSNYNFLRVVDFVRALPTDSEKIILIIHLSFPIEHSRNRLNRKAGLKAWLNHRLSCKANVVIKYTAGATDGQRAYPMNLENDTLDVCIHSRAVGLAKEAEPIMRAVGAFTIETI